MKQKFKFILCLQMVEIGFPLMASRIPSLMHLHIKPFIHSIACFYIHAFHSQLTAAAAA